MNNISSTPDPTPGPFYFSGNSQHCHDLMLRTARNPRTTERGDLWLASPDPPPGTDPEECDAVWLLVIEKPSSEANVKVAPVFTCTEFAGMDDAVLPKYVTGFRGAVAFGHAMSVPINRLSDFYGCLPQEWSERLTGFHSWTLDHSSPFPADLERGRPFIDEEDPAFIFHQGLATQMDGLLEQRPAVPSWFAILTRLWEAARTQALRTVRKGGEAIEVMGARATSAAASLWEEFAAPLSMPGLARGSMDALDKNEMLHRPLKSEEFILDDGTARLLVSEVDSPPGLWTVEVLTDTGGVLEGAVILDTVMNSATTIRTGRTDEPFQIVGERFLVRYADGRFARVEPVGKP